MKSSIHVSKRLSKVLMSKHQLFLLICCIGMMTHTAVLAFAAALPHATITAVDVLDKVVVNQPIFIDVTVINDGGDAKAGGISISLPDNPRARASRRSIVSSGS